MMFGVLVFETDKVIQMKGDTGEQSRRESCPAV